MSGAPSPLTFSLFAMAAQFLSEEGSVRLRPQECGDTHVSAKYGCDPRSVTFNRSSGSTSSNWKKKLKRPISNLTTCAMLERRTDPSDQVLCELVIDVAVDDRGYIPTPNLITHPTGLGREEVLGKDPQPTLTWHRCQRTHLSGVHLVDDDAK